MSSIHEACLLAVQERIRSLGLLLADGSTPLPDANVVIVKDPWITRLFGEDRGLALPGIVISPVGNEQQLGGLNDLDDIGYPVFVSIVAADNQDLTTNLDVYLVWRQRIAAALRHQRLAGVASVITVNQLETSVFIPETFKQGFWVSNLEFSCVSREPRG